MLNKTSKLVYLAMFLAIGIVLNLLESAIIPPLPYGIRMGIANIIGLLVLYLYGKKEFLLINILRVITASLVKGSFLNTSFFVAFGGILLSSLVVILIKKDESSIIFISIISAIMHTLGQVGVICFIYSSISFGVLFPFLMLISLFTGLLIGEIAKIMIRRIRI